MSPKPNLDKARHLGRALCDLTCAIGRAERSGDQARAIHALRLHTRLFRWWSAQLSEVERQGLHRQAVLLEAARLCSSAADKDFEAALEQAVLRRLSAIALPGESATTVLDRYAQLRAAKQPRGAASQEHR